MIGGEDVNCTGYKIARAIFTATVHTIRILLGVSDISSIRTWTIRTVRSFYRTRPYVHVHTVFSLVRVVCASKLNVKLKSIVKLDSNTFIMMYWYRTYRRQQRISEQRFGGVHPIVRRTKILDS